MALPEGRAEADRAEAGRAEANQEEARRGGAGRAARIDAGGVAWHVDVIGCGPALLLLHGTGASSHSFHALAPLLAERFTVVVPDLPGHSRSSRPSARGMSVDGMARSLTALLTALGLAPAVAVGHSAGAAVLARMALDRRVALRALVGLNAALVPLAGPARVLSPLARLMASAPGVPRLVSGFARDPRAVQRLVEATGSRLDADGTRRYASLIANRGHVAGAIAMMAAWDLDATWRELPALVPAPLLVVGDRDRTVPPDQARRVAARVAGSEVLVLGGLGHLAHEEAPAIVADAIVAHAAARGVTGVPVR